MSLAKKIIITCLLLIQGFVLLPVSYGQNYENYGWALNKIVDDSIDTTDSAVKLGDRFQQRGIDNIGDGSEIRDFLAFVAVKILIPILIYAGIIVAILWFYSLFAATSPDEQKKAMKYILWWLVGIIIMVSAGYITNKLVSTDWADGILWKVAEWGTAAWAKVAADFYETIAFPLLKVAMFIVLWILFIMVIIHAFKYIFSNGEEIQKQSVTILVYNSLGIIIIILAKSMVEAVYGKYNQVVNEQVSVWWWTDLWKIGTWILNKPNFSVVHVAMNWILGLVTFIILIILIYQGYMLLMNPNDEEMATKLKKSLWYIFMGILIIGAWYLITNFFIIT